MPDISFLGHAETVDHGCSLKEAVSMPTQGMPSLVFTGLSVWQRQGEVSKHLAGVRNSSKMTQLQQNRQPTKRNGQLAEKSASAPFGNNT